MMRSRSRVGGFDVGNVMFLKRCDLVRLKCRALRRGVWFRALSRIERGLIDLAIVTVRKVRSFVLARSVAIVVEKLVDTIESNVQRRIRSVGLPLARKLSAIGRKWGNKSAVRWTTDLRFAMFLAVCAYESGRMQHARRTALDQS